MAAMASDSSDDSVAMFESVLRGVEFHDLQGLGLDNRVIYLSLCACVFCSHK